MSHIEPETVNTFGSEVQQVPQKVTTTLARYKISKNLTDLNFNDWYPVIFESLQTVGYERYLLEPITKTMQYRSQRKQDSN